MKTHRQDEPSARSAPPTGIALPGDFSLEAVILMIGGEALVLAGGVLLGAASGALPFAESGLQGLLIFIFALQALTLGKTPFGATRRSPGTIGLWMAVASVGIVAGMIPNVLGPLPRGLLGLCFAGGGGAQLVSLARDGERRALWKREGGPLRPLTPLCATVYALSIPVGLALGGVFSLPWKGTAVLLFLLGGALLLLAAVLDAVYRRYPEARRAVETSEPLSFSHTMILVTGVFMVLLGLLLVPVVLGVLPFSPSAQLGLLLFIMALRTMAAGETPLGSFPRTRPVVAAGLIFSVLGTFSCLVPEILVAPLVVLVGGLNVAGGALPFLRRGPSSAHPLARRLAKTQDILNVLAILFGLSMLFPGIIPGLVTGVLLAANGGVLLYLLHLLRQLEALLASLGSPEGRAP